eukprot:404469_1
MSKKRPLDDIEPSTDEPPTKKHKKINWNAMEIKSIYFSHPNDHFQFKQLFTIIDNSQLSQSLNIPHFINKEIAEYGNGTFKPCNNSKCDNQIPILYQDKQIYDDNDGINGIWTHKNAQKVGYKWCRKNGNKYFCIDCMANAKPCSCMPIADYDDCSTLRYIPNLETCNGINCNTLLDNGEEWCDISWKYTCFGCDNALCYQCEKDTFKTCQECVNRFCEACEDETYNMIDAWDDKWCVCVMCFDETIIECNMCNEKFPLIHASNTILFDDEFDEMWKCNATNCEIFVCFKCNESERNGKKIVCNNNYCHNELGVYCNQHLLKNQKPRICYQCFCYGPRVY